MPLFSAHMFQFNSLSAPPILNNLKSPPPPFPATARMPDNEGDGALQQVNRLCVVVLIYSPLSFSVEVGDSERVEQVLSHACASAIVMSNMTCQAMNMFSSSSTLYVLLLHFLCFAPHLLCPPCPLSPLSRNRSVPDSSNDLEQMVAPPPCSLSL